MDARDVFLVYSFLSPLSLLVSNPFHCVDGMGNFSYLGGLISNHNRRGLINSKNEYLLIMVIDKYQSALMFLIDFNSMYNK